MDETAGLFGAANGAFTPLAIANAASGLLGGIFGAIQQHKANKLLRSLQYPTETIPAEVLRNQQLAELRANTGLPTAQYEQAKQNIGRSANRAISGATDRRAGLMGIAATQQAEDDALLNLDVTNAAARQANEKQLMDVNNTVAGWKDKVWQNNVKDKYDRDYNYAMGLKGMGNQNLLGGFDKLGAAGLYGWQSGLFGNGEGKQKMQSSNDGLYDVITGKWIKY